MRIIAGEFKGRKLLSPPRRSLSRPITGRAKESVFDTLGPLLVGACVVDLYCGTGTMGLEALSRGAGRCYFAERDPAVVVRLRRNVEAVGAGDRSVVWVGDVTKRLAKWLVTLDCEVDAAFVDPPYADSRRWDWCEVQKSIFTPLASRLGAEAVVVLRTPAAVNVPEKLDRLAATRVKRFGDMIVTMFGQTS